jgi:hypothetical protein
VVEFLDYLAEHGIPALPGLDDDALDRLDAAIGVTLPEPVRSLYRACGGLDDDALEHLPMRLMSPDDLVDTAHVLFTESPEVYSPAPEAVYIFTDDNSNWAGVYHTGPLAGMATVLDHDEPSQAPRWRDLPSLLHRLVEAGQQVHDDDDEDDDDDWVDFTWLRTDYPLSPESPSDLIERAGPLAQLHLDSFRARIAGLDHLDQRAVADIETALYVLPPGRPDVLAELLRSPYQYVRYTALEVVGRHRAAELTEQVAAYARACLDNDIEGGGDPFTHLLRAYRALHAMGATAQKAEVLRYLPADWWLPDAEQLDRTVSTGPTVGEP